MKMDEITLFVAMLGAVLGVISTWRSAHSAPVKPAP